MSAAIIASGSSVKKAHVDILKGRLCVIAIKKNVELCPWADVVYGCDGAWWKSVQGLPNYKGLKLSWEASVCDQYRDIHRVFIGDVKSDRLFFDKAGHVGAGGNSGFQALNLAAQFGASRILLIGFDMTGEHWYGRNNWPMSNNPDELNFHRWKTAIASAASDLGKMGVEVVNTSPLSNIGFPKASVQDTLAAWGL